MNSQQEVPEDKSEAQPGEKEDKKKPELGLSKKHQTILCYLCLCVTLLALICCTILRSLFQDPIARYAAIYTTALFPALALYIVHPLKLEVKVSANLLGTLLQNAADKGVSLVGPAALFVVILSVANNLFPPTFRGRYFQFDDQYRASTDENTHLISPSAPTAMLVSPPADEPLEAKKSGFTVYFPDGKSALDVVVQNQGINIDRFHVSLFQPGDVVTPEPADKSPKKDQPK